jgi:hypothetical protein
MEDRSFNDVDLRRMLEYATVAVPTSWKGGL